jgi:hypothetical protein
MVYTIVATSAPHLNRNRANHRLLSRTSKLLAPQQPDRPIAEFILARHTTKAAQEAALND